MNVVPGLCHSYSGKVVTFQESVFACKRKLSKMSQIYKQKRGAAMGSPVSPIIANLYVELFEERALNTAPHPPDLWFRYVDDTFTKIHEYYVEEFTRHINSIDPNIIFTTEPESNGVLPFLDTCVHINDDGSTHVTV